MKVYIETYGCAANKSDTEIMMGLLSKAGFEFTEKITDADLLIINTCIVKTPTANRMVYRIKELKKTCKPLIVAGCMAKAEKSYVEKLAPQASLIGPNAVDRIVEVAKKTLKGEKVAVFETFPEKPSLPTISLNPIISIVQIATGCLSNCSYCETKLARGRLKSFSIQSILSKIRSEILDGKKEFWLTSQDNGCYGFDIGTNLAELLKKISSFKEKFYVRVGMMNPQWINLFLSKLIDAYSSDKIFKFFHIPVQSGSDDVLMHMKRGYTAEVFIKEVGSIRRRYPLATIATDIIVGYPTETEKDFKKTLQLIEETKPDVINISRFSSRPGTEASKLKQLPTSIVKERSRKLHKLKMKIAEENNKKWIGWNGEILVDESKNAGRNFAYKQVIIKTHKNLFGKTVKVRVISSKSNFLIAKILNE